MQDRYEVENIFQLIISSHTLLIKIGINFDFYHFYCGKYNICNAIIKPNTTQFRVDLC